MLTCTNGHTFPKTDSDATLVTECPTCGEKLSEIISPDNSGTLLDSHLISPSENRAFVKPESIDNTLVPNSVDEEPNSNLLATQDFQGTLLDSQLLKPESISPTQSNTSIASDIKTVDVQKTEAINDLNATLDMVPGVDTCIQKQPNFDGLTNKVVTDPDATYATLDMVPGVDTRIQKQPNFDDPTKPLSNSDLEKTGVHQNIKIVIKNLIILLIYLE